jgi:hypothetical protein
VTAGIVSAKARNINILSDNSAIEDGCSGKPGNSGGNKTIGMIPAPAGKGMWKNYSFILNP